LEPFFYELIFYSLKVFCICVINISVSLRYPFIESNQ
jgi:hypothetical protein